MLVIGDFHSKYINGWWKDTNNQHFDLLFEKCF